MAKRKPKEPLKPSNVFWCHSCEGDPQFEQKEFMDHIRAVHKITNLKGKRTMTLHLDCADSYTSAYDWKIGDITFSQSVTMPRQKSDLLWSPDLK